MKIPSKIQLLILSVTALLAGMVNGFLGTGGGILLVFILELIGLDRLGLDSRDRFASVIAVILVLSLVSLYFYSGVINFESTAAYIPAGMLGGFVGACLLDRINLVWLKKLFAVMVIWAGICFLR